MINTIYAIIRKEWKEMYLQRGRRRSGIYSVGIIIIVLGIFMPLQFGAAWLSSPIVLLTWSWVPLFMAIGMVTDSFAGERERHTLETLLASCLSDREILMGKVASAVSFAWFISLVSILVSAVTVNIAHWSGSVVFYPAVIFFSGLSLSLLASILMAALGVLVSLNAPTARAAYQRLSIAIFAVWFIPMIGIQLVPVSWRPVLQEFVLNLNYQRLLFIGMAVLLIADVVLLGLAQARFKRNRLILD